MRIDLDKRQSQELARFVVENSDRIDTVHLTIMRTGVVRAEAVNGSGKIVDARNLRAKVA